MPSFLIVSATKFEILPLLDRFKIEVNANEGLFTANAFPEVYVLITGVGMVNTAFWMGTISGKSFDCLINAGICGAFHKTLRLGEVVLISEDTLAELGAQDGDSFIKYDELNLGGKNSYLNLSVVPNAFKQLKTLRSITVNTVHGNETFIQKTKERFSPDVESMEGAAFFRGCENVHNCYLQLRSVSNYVEKRDKSKWDIPIAIKNLNDLLIKFIEEQA